MSKTTETTLTFHQTFKEHVKAVLLTGPEGTVMADDDTRMGIQQPPLTETPPARGHTTRMADLGPERVLSAPNPTPSLSQHSASSAVRGPISTRMAEQPGQGQERAPRNRVVMATGSIFFL